ncbi:hypothetical protein MRX96_047980 [Rhipicephalus microplus]
MDVRRPKQGETDEELIRLQEEFLQSGEKPSVYVAPAERNIREPKAKTHSVADPNETTSVCDRIPPISTSNASDKSPEVVHVQLDSILCDVIERNVDKDVIRPPSPSVVPFPESTKVSGHCVTRSQEPFCIKVQEDGCGRARG